MLVHLGLAPPPEGWDPTSYDNVARLHSGHSGARQGKGPPPRPSGPGRWPASAAQTQEMKPFAGGAHASRAPLHSRPAQSPEQPARGACQRGGSYGPFGGRAQPERSATYDKEREVVFGFEYDDERRNGVPYEDELRRDLATSYYWSGSFWKDYVFFVANWHPLFGILCSHPLHPWSKPDRFGSLLISSSLTLLPSVMLSQSTEALCEEWGDHTGKCGWLISHILIMLFITTPVMFVEVALYLFAMYTNVYCREGTLCVCCKKSFFITSLVVSAVVLWASSEILRAGGHEISEELVHPFLVSRLQSCVVWFPLWFVMPCMGFWHYWNIERRSLKRSPGR